MGKGNSQNAAAVELNSNGMRRNIESNRERDGCRLQMRNLILRQADVMVANEFNRTLTRVSVTSVVRLYFSRSPVTTNVLK